MFRSSRYRRASRMDAIALGLLLVLLTALGITVTPVAQAQPSNVAYAYAATYGQIICDVLDDGHATISGMLGIGQGIMEDGLTAHQAGEAIAISITEICPRHTGLLLLFIDTYGPTAARAKVLA